MQVIVDRMPGPPVEAQPVEVVERKGLGHPDTICDTLAEEFSLALSRFYRERFGAILHHNVDKALLFGGRSEPAFGGGRVHEPIEIFLAGRAVVEVRGVRVPFEELAVEGSRRWLAAHLHALDAGPNVRIHPLVRPSSVDLLELAERARSSGMPLANDTSCGVGYAPLSPLERAVLDVERELNAPSRKLQHPELGEDVKVMGVRRGAEIELTVACAFVDRFLRDASDYLAARERARLVAAETARAVVGHELRVIVNAADDPARGSLYLTVTGTSAEAGDDGEAGRGNRANGLVAPYRPTTLESTSGKNPVTHVGKLYNLAAGLISQDLVDAMPEVCEAQCVLVSRIGDPVSEPQIVEIRLRRGDAGPVAELATRAREIARDQLERLPALAEELLEGRLAIGTWPLRI